MAGASLSEIDKFETRQGRRRPAQVIGRAPQRPEGVLRIARRLRQSLSQPYGGLFEMAAVVVCATRRARSPDAVASLVKIASGVDERWMIAGRPRARGREDQRRRRLTRGVIQQFEPFLNRDHIVRRAVVERGRNGRRFRRDLAARNRRRIVGHAPKRLHARRSMRHRSVAVPRVEIDGRDDDEALHDGLGVHRHAKQIHDVVQHRDDQNTKEAGENAALAAG